MGASLPRGMAGQVPELPPRYLDGWSRSRPPGAPTRPDWGSRLRDSAGFAPDFPWISITWMKLCANTTMRGTAVSKEGGDPRLDHLVQAGRNPMGP